mgnify:CR=1 FL=1
MTNTEGGYVGCCKEKCNKPCKWAHYIVVFILAVVLFPYFVNGIQQAFTMFDEPQAKQMENKATKLQQRQRRNRGQFVEPRTNFKKD